MFNLPIRLQQLVKLLTVKFISSTGKDSDRISDLDSNLTFINISLYLDLIKEKKTTFNIKLCGNGGKIVQKTRKHYST